MSDRKAFEKWCNANTDYTYWEVWQAAQAQASKPIAAVHGWFHGECVIQALDPAAVLPTGMALYAAPQPVVDEGYVLVPRAAVTEVLRISDRQHPAWEEVRTALLSAGKETV